MSVGRWQRGDTIVEVMIVLAILGLAISVSYATANQSLLAARQAQENSQAAELLQSQIELLQSMRKNPATPPGIYPRTDIYVPGPYCVDTGSKNIWGTSTAHGCTYDSQGQTVIPSSSNVLYTVSITQVPGDIYGYQFMAQWPDVRGEGNDTATFYYRIYPT